MLIKLVKLFLLMAVLLIGWFFAVTPNILPMGYQTDKMLHIFIFCILSLLLTLKHGNNRKKLLIGQALILCIGGLTEIIQIITPDRTAQIEDALSNVIGAILGMVIGYLLKTGYNAGNQKAANT